MDSLKQKQDTIYKKGQQVRSIPCPWLDEDWWNLIGIVTKDQQGKCVWVLFKNRYPREVPMNLSEIELWENGLLRAKRRHGL